jgi:transcriptional regulator with XRE-family HTH domain
MPAEVDEQRLRRLLAQGKSQREIAQALNIPRTSLQRLIKTLNGSSSPQPLSPAPAISPPVVDTSTLSPAELDAVKADFWEMITWWRDRKLKLIQASTPRDTQRQTYHVERRYIELIKHEAETEGVSITEVVNRALRMYFERR